MSMIDRYLLRYFLAVIDCGSFSKAAKQLNVAQPSLSVGIGKLERILGAPLFQRTSRRVHITDAGSRFAAHARRIENEFNLAEASVANLKPARSLRLGVISTYPISQLAEILRAAKRTPDPERLQIITGNERELLHRLGRGQIEAALTIVRPNADGFAKEELYAERYALALSEEHPLAARPSIAAEDLSDSPMIVRRHCEVLAEISRHFTERGVRPFLAFRGTDDEQVLHLVRAGVGATVMPESYAMPGVTRPRLAGFNLRRQMGIVYAAHAAHLQHAAPPVIEAVRARYSGVR